MPTAAHHKGIANETGTGQEEEQEKQKVPEAGGKHWVATQYTETGQGQGSALDDDDD